MGGIDKFLKSAERKGIITIEKTNKKKGITNIKKNEWKTIEIDTEYFLKTGIKREMKTLKQDKSPKKRAKTFNKKEWSRKYYLKNKNLRERTPLEIEIDKRTSIQRNKNKCLRHYYKNRDERKIQRKKRYAENKDKERKRYNENREYYIEKAKLNYRIRKIREKNRQYFKNNILPLINNASNKE